MIHGAESVDVTSQVAWLEIEPADSGCQLLYFSAHGDCFADTWHERVEDAKAQAQFEFAIDEHDWSDLSSDT